MSKEQAIRESVEDFVRRESSPYDARRLFAAWVLNTQHQVNVLDALAQTGSAGGDDDPASEDLEDGFLLVPATAYRPHELLVVRAVLSNDEGELLRGLATLGRSLVLAGTLAHHGRLPSGNVGPKLRRLRAALDVLPSADRATLRIRGELWSLLAETPEALQQNIPFRRASNEFLVTLARGQVTADFNVRTLSNLRINTGPTAARPAAAREISFLGTQMGSKNESVWIGRGKLADMVALYEHYREALFAKNVRTYLHLEAKKPRSAARHIRQALDEMCDGAPSLYFTMSHNGITLTSPHASEVDYERIKLEPLNLGLFVLNGCQTVYTAWSYFKDREEREGRDGDARWRAAWGEIWIPLRIVVTSDEERVRQVTVAANRQTEMRPSAFWAHDATQVQLDARFGRAGIFYERQQSAWDNLVRSESPRAQQYPNGVINIEDLARTIAAASHDISIDHAKGPSGIFDSEQVYRKVFALEKVRSVALLTALYNVQQATRLALRDLVGGVSYLADLPVMSFQYAAFRLAVAWLAEEVPNELLALGDGVYRGVVQRELRERMVKVLGPSRSKVQSALRDYWMTDEGWQDAYNVKLLRRAMRELGFTRDPFSIDIP